MRRLGFLVNPCAGMGGSVGLKGTDGKVAEAIQRGAVPHAQDRALATLLLLAKDPDLRFTTCSGRMGEDVLRAAGIMQYEVLYRYSGESTAEDTRRAVREFAKAGVDLILFCGGDGTARDIFDSVGKNVPMLGIPAGVKMYSAVFALDPATAATILLGSGTPCFMDGEVMDVDEDAYRKGILSTRLYGFARVPCSQGNVQVSKEVYEAQDEYRAQMDIARFISDIMLPDTLYLLGAGTTVEAIAHRLGTEKTLLGIDAIKNRKRIASDLNETGILALLKQEKTVRIIISPIGSQGFILGRGNQQLSAEVVRRVGVSNIIVVATPHKLRETPVLYVDTGDSDLDAGFGESIQVVSGYAIAQRKKIHRRAGS